MPLERVIRIGRVVSSKVGTPKNAKSRQARLLTIQVGPQLKTAQLVPPAGEDFNPPVGSTVVLLESGGWLYAIGSADDVDPDTNLSVGAKEIRSTDGSGNLSVRLRFKTNGKAYLANAGQNLKTALQTLVEGIQGATYIPYPGGVAGPPVAIADATGKIATALTALQALLDSSP